MPISSSPSPIAQQAPDLLMCVGPADVDYLFPVALRLACEKLTSRVIHLVTPDPRRVADAARACGASGRTIVVHSDDSVLSPSQASLPGWLRQQMIKLNADRICTTKHIWCLGADTLVVRPVCQSDVCHNSHPIIFFNRYPRASPHLAYERRRVLAAARILGVVPLRSHLLGDFIFDLTMLDRDHLAGLREWVLRQNGRPLEELLPTQVRNMGEKMCFGEWTLYAVYLLDVLHSRALVRKTRSDFVAQVHSTKDLSDDRLFHARAIHVVPKGLPRSDVLRRFESLGLL